MRPAGKLEANMENDFPTTLSASVPAPVAQAVKRITSREGLTRSKAIAMLLSEALVARGELPAASAGEK